MIFDNFNIFDILNLFDLFKILKIIIFFFFTVLPFFEIVDLYFFPPHFDHLVFLLDFLDRLKFVDIFYFLGVVDGTRPS